MSRTYTGKTHESQVERRQANGDVYVYRRITQYSRETRKTVTLKMELLGKKVPGSTELVETRAKRSQEQMAEIKASRIHVGMTDILDWVGKASKIDEDVMRSMDEQTALKLISVARFMAVSNHGSMAGFENYQITHAIPYEQGLNEVGYHNLFAEIGQHEQYMQAYFACRASHLTEKDSIAFDSTTISTDSSLQIEARQGFNKDGDGKNTIKLLTLYSVQTHQPIAFAKEPGNIPDVVSIENTLKQLDVLNLKRPELVTDSGYYSEENILAFLRAHVSFLTAAARDVTWIRAAYEKHLPSLASAATVCPYDPTEIHGMTIPLKHTFVWKYERAHKEHTAGEEKSQEFRLYLHVFRSMRKMQTDAAIDHEKIEGLKAQILAGQTEFKPSAQRMIDKWLIVRHCKGKVSVTLNAKNLDERAKYYGIFVLLSNRKEDCFEALSKYRRRNRIEEFFKLEKEFADGARPRVWNCDTLKGRMFAQFVALGYLSFLYARESELKERLGKKTGEPEHDTEKNLKAEQKLLSWMKDHSLQQKLKWFDCTEKTSVSTGMGKVRWITENTSRDRLYLKSLGVTRKRVTKA